MKTLKTLTILTILLFALSCSKDDANDEEINADLVLNKTERVVVGPIRNLTDRWWAVRAGLTDEFYIHNASNSANVGDKGFMVYNVNTNTFTDKLQSDAVAAAGYGSQLFYRSETINYIANTSMTYNMATNIWTQNVIPFPTNIMNNHGESKSCVIDNKVFFVGGREPCKTVKFYDWLNNSWNFGADYPIAISSGPELAFTTNNNTIYALGGIQNNETSKEFFKYNLATNTWQKLADTPEAPYHRTSLKTMVTYKNKFVVFYGENRKLYVYNIEKNKWQTSSIDTGTSVKPYLEVSVDGSKIFLLYKKVDGALGLQEYKE